MSDDLFMAPQRDDFSHESPIRAFTDWREKGHYAIGKGFRPSVQHLAPYLDAMERKENWRVVQVLDAGNGLTILFRSVRLKIMLSPLQDVDGEPYIDEERLARFAEAGEKIDAAEKAADEMDQEELPRYVLKLYGFNAKKIRELMERCADDTFEVIIGDNKTVDDLDPPEGWMFTGWRGGRVAIFERTRPAVAPIFEPDRQHPLYDSKCTLPEGWKPDDTTVEMGTGSPPPTMHYRKPAHAPTEKVVAQTVKIVMQDDPVNPKHYAGTACAEIGELLSANSYQVLKYIWRLGEKDDPVVELGKALWYLDRERKMYPNGCKTVSTRIERHFILSRLQGKADHVGQVVAWLVSWHHYGKRETLKLLEDYLTEMKEKIEAERENASCTDLGRGLEP